jgi:5-methyltetrahydrofolate--homocysteine methyltransferase
MMNEKDETGLIRLIRQQAEAGADYLDINTAACRWGEAEAMVWVAGLALAHASCGLMLDSPDHGVILEALAHTGDRKVIVNSVTLTNRFDELAPVCAQRGLGVVAMPIGDRLDSGIGQRMENIALLARKLRAAGVSEGDIYMDIVVEALATNGQSAAGCLSVIRFVKENYPGIQTLAGLSNISFGLPGRSLINRCFLSAAVQAGRDAAIMDVGDEDLTAALFASEALAGRDEYCMEYIAYFRGRE